MIDSPNREMGQLGKRKDRKQVKISVANAVPWPTVSSRARYFKKTLLKGRRKAV